MYKKRMLNTAVAAALAAGMGTAQAVVDLDNDTDTPVFASEIEIPAGTGGKTLTNAGNILDVNVQFGFGADAGVDRFIRFDLGAGAQFNLAPTYTIGADAGVISAGGAGESFVIFSVTPAAAVASTDVGTLTVNNLDVFAIQSVSIDYGQYETGAGAAQQNPDALLASESGTLASFASGLAATVDDVNPERIDVTQSSLFFETVVGDDTTIIGDVNIDAAPNVFWDTGVQVTLPDLVAAGTALVVDGDFTAAQDAPGGVPDGNFTVPSNTVFMSDNVNCTTIDDQADALDGTSATFNLDTNPVADARVLCMTVNGFTEIQPTTFTGLYDVTPAAASTLGDEDLGILSVLEKNGDTETAYVVTRPDAVDSTFLRITNKGTIAGEIFVTLWAQDGTVIGTRGATLIDSLGGNQTAVLSSADIATAVGATTWPGRARAVIESNVPDIAVMNLVRTNDVLTNQSTPADRP